MQVSTSASGFTIGVCASDSSPNLPSLVTFLLKEDLAEFMIKRVVIVASGCDEGVVSEVRRIAEFDYRVLLITEPERRGKAEAINRIVENSDGEYLVFVNSDAVPEAGSIRKLLLVAAEDESVGCVSARPVFDQGAGFFQDSLGLMWSAHNLVALHLNHAGLSNHSSDELMLVRRGVFSKLPAQLVNDGAYIGGLAKARGFVVKVSADAKVSIAVPKRVDDLISQRRRIIYGHIQVWKKLRNPPRTMESLLFTRPYLSVRLLVSLLARNPRSIIVLPVVATSEIISAFFAIVDWIQSTEKHAVWRRFER